METRPHIVVLYMYMLGMVLSGASNGIATKLTNKSVSLGQEFKHPWFQTIMMFIGESMCMLVYLYQVYSAKRQYGSYQMSPDVLEARKRGKSTDINPLLLAIPMF